MLAMTLLPQSTLLKDRTETNGSKDVSKGANQSNVESLMMPKIKASAVMYRHPDAKPDSLKIDASTGDIIQG